MQYKRILLLIWISLMFIAAIYFLLQRDQPTSALTTSVKIKGGAEVVLYKEAQLLDQQQEDGKIILVVEGKAYIDAGKSDKQIVVKTDEATIELSDESAVVIDASEPYTTEVMTVKGTVLFRPNKDKPVARIQPLEIIPGEKGLITPHAKGVIMQNNRDKNFMAWVDFKLTFNQTPMPQVVEILDATYGSRLSLEFEFPSRCKVTGQFEGLSYEKFIETIARQFDLTATQKEDGSWSLSGAGC